MLTMGKEFVCKTNHNGIKIEDIPSNILEVLLTMWGYSIYQMLVLFFSFTELKRQKITCLTTGPVVSVNCNKGESTDHDLISFYEQLQQYRPGTAVKPNGTNIENTVEVWVVMVLIITSFLCVLLDMYWCSHTLCIAVTNHKNMRL